MKLNVMERIITLNLLPAEGSFANIKLLRVAREALSFDDLENKKLQFVQNGDTLNWKLDADVGEKEITLGEIVTQMIVKELKKLDDEEKLTEQHFSLFEKFMT